MKSNKHEEKHRRLRRMARELSRRQDLKYRDAVWAPCEPFQYGWFRDYVLREDVARGPHAAVLQRILDRIGKRQWCKEQDFLGYPINGKRHPMDPPVIETIPVHFELKNGRDVEVGWPFPDGYRKWFRYHSHATCTCFPKKRKYFYPWFSRPHYCFSKPWMFEMRVRPAIITKLKVIDPENESEMAKLENRMHNERGWAHLYGTSYRDDLRPWFNQTTAMRELEEALQSNTYE